MPTQQSIPTILQQTAKVGLYVTVIKSSFSVAQALLKNRGLAKVDWPDSIRFGAFVASLSGGYKITEVILRKLRNTKLDGKPDKLNSIIAGAVAGLSMFIDSPSRRPTVALYTCVNAVNFVFHWALKNGYFPAGESLPFGISTYYIFLICLCASWTLFCLGFHPETFFAPYRKFLTNFGNIRDDKMVIYRDLYKKQEETGRKQPENESPWHGFCNALHPNMNCWQWVAATWLQAFRKCLSFYGPIHSISFFLGGWRNPAKGLKNVAVGTFWSSMFLATYISVVHRFWCWGRWIQQKEHPIHLATGGFMSGFALLFEHENRRADMALWCLPQVWKSIWSYFVKKGYVSSIQNGDVLLFSIGISLTMYCYHHQTKVIKPTYRKLLDSLWK